MKNIINKIKFFIKVYVLGFIGFIVTYLINKTIRWEVIYEDNNVKENFPRRGVAAFWHAHQLVMAPITNKAFIKKNHIKAYVLISKHSDGRLIANVMKYYGLGSVAGSTSTNAKGASLTLLKKLENDNTLIGITPDGPKGPKNVAKLGAVQLASLSNTPIILIAYDFKDKWTFNSWDKMFLPKPFTKGVLVIGKLLHIPQNLTDEQKEIERKRFEDELNKICDIATKKIATYE